MSALAMERATDLRASSLPDRTDPTTAKRSAEDMPVKQRQQPGYEPVGIRAGSWMFNPSLITGGFYDSNVFASNTAPLRSRGGDRADLARARYGHGMAWT
jgi:hypothetical protein